MKLQDLQTPSLYLDVKALDHNLSEMSKVLPGPRLRPHVKAHKTTALAKRQAELGHRGFTCATARELIGMAEAGLGEDLLLANEILDERRLTAMAKAPARVTVAIDSKETAAAAAKCGIGEVVVDVNVGMPRCGCAPDRAGALADYARSLGLSVRGVMGYEGHLMNVEDREIRTQGVAYSMQQLVDAHGLVGGELISAGGTGSYDVNSAATEIQAGSYALMDADYGKLGLPFRQALFLWTTVISLGPGFAVCDGGLKSLGMDHGDPTMPGAAVWFCSDEHITFKSEADVRVGQKVPLIPAHVDPTMALHERVHLVDGEEVIESWPIDLRGW